MSTISLHLAVGLLAWIGAVVLVGPTLVDAGVIEGLRIVARVLGQ